MRYVVLFDNEGCPINVIHYVGLKLHPDEEVKRLQHDNFRRFSEPMLVELCGENWEDKMFYLELDEAGKVFFNADRYAQSLEAVKDNTIIPNEGS